VTDKKYHPCATDPYSYDDFQEMIEWDIDKKLLWSTTILFQVFNRTENRVVAFSGGKSSLVTLHLALNLDGWEEPDVVFNDTGIMYPETKPYVKELSEEWDFNLIITKPQKGFWECVEEYGFPETRTGSGEPRCCFWLKTRPMREVVKDKKYDLMITGEQGTESMQRRLSLMQYGGFFEYHKWNIDHKLYKAKPLAIWQDKDVWDYIERNNLPINPAYEKHNLDRTGCVTCTGYKGWEKEMKDFSMKLYKKIKKQKDGF